MKKVWLLIALTCIVMTGFSQEEVLVWSDEFDGSGPPDPAKWSYDLGAGGWGNREVQTYTNSTANSRQENGKLIINALKYGSNWTSARLLTNNKFEFKYGRVVFRAKLPVGSGTWPALWMLGENFGTVGWPACGEIDVMEFVGKHPGQVQSALHTPSSHGNTVNFGKKLVPTCSSEFHDYQVSWNYQRIEFRVDSLLIYAYSPSVRNTSTWPFDKPFFIIMNMAMGGNMGSDPQYETGGQKNGIDPTLTSATMEVDFVRVYQSPVGIGDDQGNAGDPVIEKQLSYPNPTDGSLVITAQGDWAKGTVYNMVGKAVYDFTRDERNGRLDISFLPGGVYFLAIKTENGQKVQKIVLR